MQEKQEREHRRDFDHQPACDNLKIFQFNVSNYPDSSEISVQHQDCLTLRCSVKRISSSTKRSLQFGRAIRKGGIHCRCFPIFILFWATCDCQRMQNIRKYNSALSTGAVTANCVSRGPGSLHFSPKITCKGNCTTM